MATYFIVMLTGFATVTALEAMKLGAFDYIRKPFRVDQIPGDASDGRSGTGIRIPSGERSRSGEGARPWRQAESTKSC